MLMANGISRRTVFTSHMVSVLPVAAFMAAVDSINHIIFSALTQYQSFFYQIYHNRFTQSSFGTSALITLEGFIWMFFVYAMMAMIGYFISTLYYRMNKPLKLIVSIGVPILLFIVLPYIDVYISGLQLFKGIWVFIAQAWGFVNDNPYIAMLSSAITFVVFGALSYLLIRKAQVKDN